MLYSDHLIQQTQVNDIIACRDYVDVDADTSPGKNFPQGRALVISLVPGGTHADIRYVIGNLFRGNVALTCMKKVPDVESLQEPVSF